MDKGTGMMTSRKSWNPGVPGGRNGIPARGGAGGPRPVDRRPGAGNVAGRHGRPGGRSARPGMVELVFDHMHSEWAMELIRGVEQVATAERVALVLSELDGARRPGAGWFDNLLARRPLGVIFVLIELDDLQRRRLTASGIPFVFVDTAEDLPPGVPVVGSANWAGGVAAARHLTDLGHRRIGVISGPTSLLCSRARLGGFHSALAAEGLPAEPDHVRRGEFRAHSGYLHGIDLLDRADRPTAIFAGSDYQALGVLRAAHELGLSVPDDLSVIGYDDLTITEWIGPPLTTVHQPLRDMAAIAAQMVITLARGRQPPHQRIDLATELVVRQSTAPPRER
ncbi:substrate-binding domain-containing protein [Saccharothrix sp. HUAS TT1]|uniref:substrate-binding domain-containing protein n=1 Tax=unclassified Saccharothrix TaxID=2593673 RepID=UPI00345BB960